MREPNIFLANKQLNLESLSQSYLYLESSHQINRLVNRKHS